MIAAPAASTTVNEGHAVAQDADQVPLRTLAFAVLAPFAALGVTALPMLLDTALRGLAR